jgi:hypothetical protein
VGFDDDYIKNWVGRVEVFEIAEDEQLIGCEIHEWIDDNGSFAGVTWIKIKLTD